ncbi:MAG: hypothetical protein CMD39_09675 [Gammaproteobacteria bacterium]|nr:hypothetical protein [Gammaproteobacteria bacterium]
MAAFIAWAMICPPYRRPVRPSGWRARNRLRSMRSRSSSATSSSSRADMDDDDMGSESDGTATGECYRKAPADAKGMRPESRACRVPALYSVCIIQICPGATMAEESPARYNIGAAARLSGVSREKIRIWERRYGAVSPGRDAGNHRLYSQDDVDRLALIRALVDRGHAVSKVATLSRSELEDRLARSSEPARPAVTPDRALVVSPQGESIIELLRHHGIASAELVEDVAAATTFLADRPVELLIVDLPTLRMADLPPLTRLYRQAAGAGVIVVFRFAPLTVVEQLRALGIQAVKAPLQPNDLQLPPPAAADHLPATAHDRRFTPEALRRAAALGDRMLCECPRHLVDLITDLNAFEDYSLECQVESAADAAVHREIYDIVSRARALVEDALAIVADEHKAP